MPGSFARRCAECKAWHLISYYGRGYVDHSETWPTKRGAENARRQRDKENGETPTRADQMRDKYLRERRRQR